MSSSDIAGVPFSGVSKPPLMLRLPDGDWSVTVPSISTVLLYTDDFGWAVTVVALGPLPMQ